LEEKEKKFFQLLKKVMNEKFRCLSVFKKKKGLRKVFSFCWSGSGSDDH